MSMFHPPFSHLILSLLALLSSTYIGFSFHLVCSPRLCPSLISFFFFLFCLLSPHFHLLCPLLLAAGSLRTPVDTKRSVNVGPLSARTSLQNITL